MNYSERLRIWISGTLETRKLSQRELAEQLGWSESVISRLISGDRAIDVDEIECIETILGVRAPGPQVDAGAANQEAAPRSTLQLGHQVALPDNPDKAVLDRVANPHTDTRYLARFTAPEFTSLCPVTGQPDFAHLVIDYVPKDWLVESKSLKLYLGAFRNHGAFHEDCTVAIGKRLVTLLEPHFLRIGGYWYPRGGIPIDVFWQSGRCPPDVWLPDQGVAPYRGRG